MHRNEGNLDRIVRLVIAAVAVLVGAAVGFASIGGIIAAIVAVVMVVTAASGFCPIYAVLHVDTCPNRAPQK